MNQYTDGTYLAKNPTWDVEDSPWKAENVIKLIKQNKIDSNSIAEVGCGVGEVLNQMHNELSSNCSFFGYEISPQAIEQCNQRKKLRLEFHLKDILKEEEQALPFDIIMALDVFEHVENYIEFLKQLKSKAKYKIFHIPLDMSIVSVAKITPILNAREKVGHLHYFCKETAFATLIDNGYEVIDWFYTSGPRNRPPRQAYQSNHFIDFIKLKTFNLNPDKWVRLFGGSIIVLAK